MDRKQKEHELFESENKVEKTVRMVEENIKTARMEETIQQTLRMDADSENSAMDESDEDTSLHIGEVITGNYKTTKVFKYNTGEAVIYFCKKNEEKYVAKVYFDNIKPKNKVLEKVSKIKSKYVIPTIEHGVHERTKRYFEIMPFYKNGDLSKKKTYSTDFLIDVVVPSVNEGLRAIHQAQIVHRDIKPNNIFIGNDQSYVVLGDFGISSHIENGTVVKTRNSNRTDGYAAPELYNNFICKENDYFSFGIMLIELVNGEHPFKDLTSEQIMTAVCTQPIPIPNEPRLYQLINGLTLKDRNNRWGYDEVKRWLNGEVVPIAEDRIVNPNVKPYLFEGKQFYQLDDLALAFANNWRQAKKHLYRGLVRDFLKQFGEDYTSKIIDCEENRNHDLGLFELITFIHSNPPICWKGQIYKDLEGLKNAVEKKLPDKNATIEELLKMGALLNYLRRFKSDEKNKDFFMVIQNISKQAKNNSELAYYRLAITLLGKPVFHYRGKVFGDVESFITFLHDNKKILNEYANELLNNQYFLAWLTQLGYEKHINEWRSILTN